MLHARMTVDRGFNPLLHIYGPLYRRMVDTGGYLTEVEKEVESPNLIDESGCAKTLEKSSSAYFPMGLLDGKSCGNPDSRIRSDPASSAVHSVPPLASEFAVPSRADGK